MVFPKYQRESLVADFHIDAGIRTAHSTATDIYAHALSSFIVRPRRFMSDDENACAV